MNYLKKNREGIIESALLAVFFVICAFGLVL
jgi:hypothetical protein